MDEIDNLLEYSVLSCWNPSFSLVWHGASKSHLTLRQITSCVSKPDINSNSSQEKRDPAEEIIAVFKDHNFFSPLSAPKSIPAQCVTLGW